MQESKTYLIWVVLGIIGVVLLVISAFAGIDQLKKAKGDAELISQLPVIEYADYERAEPGTLMVITGILQSATEPSRPEDLIIYYEQTWNTEYDEDDGWTGQWDTYTFSIPKFMIMLSSGKIPVLGAERTLIDLPNHIVMVSEPGTGQVVDGITDGAKRQLGFKENDLITVVGNTSTEGLIPTRISGGSREDLLTNLSYRVSGLKIAALVFGVIGFVLLVFAGRKLFFS